MSNWIDDMADDSAEDDKDNENEKRVKWYEMGEETDEGNNEQEDDDGNSEGKYSQSQGLCTDTPAISTNSTSEGLGSLHPPFAKNHSELYKGCF